jgi:hypothetical protein
MDEAVAKRFAKDIHEQAQDSAGLKEMKNVGIVAQRLWTTMKTMM